MATPPPQGMTEVDYEAIEAAVTETVRGRWFLNEFARRNRVAETRLLLDSMTRLEATVAASQTGLPPVDPSIRLLVQRIKEIGAHLDGLSREMRVDGIEERYWAAVDQQARAVGALMRGPSPTKTSPPVVEASLQAPLPRPPVKLPPADLPPSLARRIEPQGGADPRLAALSRLDGLTLAQKLTLFS